jgi:hypothetical protein
MEAVKLRINLIKPIKIRSRNRSQNGQFPRSRGNGNGNINKNNTLTFPFPPFPKKTGTANNLKNKEKKSFPRSHILRIWWGSHRTPTNTGTLTPSPRGTNKRVATTILAGPVATLTTQPQED